MIIDQHILHSLPLSNPNRDDLNQPKTSYYGGTERARISSQSSKREIRIRIENRLNSFAVRTRRVPAAVSSKLQERGWEASKADTAGSAIITTAAVKGLGIGDNGGTTGMLFLPKTTIEQLTDLAENNHQELLAAAKNPKKSPDLVQKVTSILTSINPSIALMGRMLAHSEASTVNAALSVAHSVTTHATVSQPDYFSAVDDLPGEDAGSAHMGTHAYTSGTHYRYSTLNIRALLENLQGDVDLARKATVAALEESALYTPQAKRNATAPHTPPALVYMTVRQDRPMSLAGAFEAPVRANATSGWVGPSVDALEEHVEAINAFYPGNVLTLYTGTFTAREIPALGERVPNLNAAVERITDAAFQDGTA